MKKFKCSLLAKIIAFVLITISGVLSIASIIGMVAFSDANVYIKSYEDLKKEMEKSISEKYSYRVINDFINSVDKDYSEKYGFSYGLLKTDNIERIDINNSNNYIKKNFLKKIELRDVYYFEHMVSPYWHYEFEDGLFGYACEYEVPHDSITSWYVDSIVYDTQNGIYYYHTRDDDTFYPVKKLKFTLFGKEYIFEFDKASEQPGYVLKSKGNFLGTVASIEDEYKLIDIDDKFPVGDSEVNLEEFFIEYENGRISLAKAKRISSLLGEVGQKVDFTLVFDDDFDYTMINNMLLDDVRKVTNTRDEIVCYSIGDVYNPQEKYYLDKNYSLKVEHEQQELEIPYEIGKYTVMILPPSDYKAALSGNAYEQGLFFVNLVYNFRYSIYIIMVISIVITLALFIFLLASSGYRKDKATGEIKVVASILQKIPLEIEISIVILLAVAVIMSVHMISSLGEPAIYFVLSMLVVFSAWVGLSFFMSFAIRVKLGKWWRNTICYKILAFFGRIIRDIYSNKDILGKYILIVAGLVALKILVFLISVSMSEFGIILLLGYQVVLDIAIVILFLRCVIQFKLLQEASKRIVDGNLETKIDTTKMFSDFRRFGDSLNSVNDGISKAVEERLKSEHFRTELITNVSHDIKTPLTSIINYVDLLSKEDLQNDKANEYLEVLDRQSSKLKKLIEDLVEASKASTGSMSVQMEKIDLSVFLTQTVGEWTERLESKNLQLVITKPDTPVYINADGRHLWRVVDNLMNNIFKYAQSGSRVYVNLETQEMVILTFRNISEYPLNVSASELMERFVRGDKSRNSEGHGLGLSIAQSLMNIMNSKLELYVDGDLFKVILSFDKIQ